MGFITKPNNEGEKKECQSCGMDLVARLTDYKGRFPDKLQWQSANERKAHYDKDGNCKDSETTQESATLEPKEPEKKEIGDVYSETKTKIEASIKTILKIRKQVTETVKEFEGDPHPGMIWEMTALIFKKYYGDKS